MLRRPKSSRQGKGARSQTWHPFPLGFAVAALAALGAAAVVPEASSAVQESRFKEWGQNPFVNDRKPALVPAPTSAGGLTLNGILWDERNPFAVLNNQVVGVGDRVGAWEVVAIEKNRIVVSNGAETQTLDSP